MCEISVIIPNYNGLRFLPDCLDALKTQTMGSFETIVVDNGSSDGSVDHVLRERMSGLRLIRFDENTGFSAAVNAGIKASHSKYVLLLNNDTVPEPDFVEKLYASIEKDEHIFAVSSQMIKSSDHSLIDSAGDGITWLGWAYQRGIDEPAAKYSRERKVFSACAGAAIYRREVFEKIGYFDEMHFAYLEDIDISWRARLYGYEIMYCPEARVYHLGSATSGSKYNSFKVRLSTRNNIYLHYKNQPTPQLIINFIPLCLGIAGKAVFFRKKGFYADYKAGLKEGFATRRSCRRVTGAGFYNCLRTEGMMLAGLAEYTVSFVRRHTGK